MAHAPAIAALKAKRIEIIQRLDDHREQARLAVVALDHVEAALRILDPAIDLSEIRPRKVAVVLPDTRGDSCRIILEMLRKATQPISTAEITVAVMKARGMDVGDSDLRRVMANRTLANLKYWARKRGLIRSMPGPGQQLLWEIVR
jgi:hypothetical protein